MKALVIGGSGFIGLNLVDALLADGVEVRCTRRQRAPSIFLRKKPVTFVEASLQDREALCRAMEGCEVVYLAGAYYPRYSLDLAASLAEGVEGVRHACEAARHVGVRRFVYTSSIASLGAPPPGRIADERDIPPAMPEGSVYRAVKWAMEREVDEAFVRGLPAVTLLPGGCIGPWDLRCGTGGVLVGVARGLLPWWVEGTVNLVDVGDVACAHLRAALAPPGSRFCLGGHDTRIGWLLPFLAERYGGTAPTVCLPPDEARARADEDERQAAAKRQRVAVPRELVDMVTSGQPVCNERARTELDIDFTPLEAALDRAHDWFVRFQYIPRTKERRPHEHPQAPLA